MDIAKLPELPSKRWATDFIENSPDLAIRSAKKLERSRVEACTQSNMNDFYSKVKAEVDMSKLGTKLKI